MGVTKNIVVRPLGSLERVFQVTHDISYYHNVGFLIRYKVPMNLPSPSQPSIPAETKDLILQILYPTIEKMILKHPELAVCFTDLETSNPKFIRLRGMDLNRIIRLELVNDDKDVESLLEKEHGERFDVKDQTVPLWRLVVGIRSSTVKKGLKPNNWNLVMGFFWHHSIADGRSSLPIFTAFNESLYQELNKIDDPSRITFDDFGSKILLPKKSNVPFNKTVEQCLDSKPSLTYLIREGFKEFILPTYLKKKISKGCWFGDNPRFSLTNGTTKTFLYSVSPKDMKSLVNLSRQHNTTITGSFNAAVIFSAYHRLITASNHDENLSRNAKMLAPYDSIKLCTDINLRPYTTPEIPWTQVGLYASESEFFYTYPRSDDEKGPKLDFWKLSKECREHFINDGIPESIERIGITKLIPRDQKKFEHTIKNRINDGVMGREFSLSISNVGKFQKFSPGSKGNSFAKEWKINDLIFTQSADTLSSGMVISVISYKNKLTFVISAQDGAIDHKKIARFGAGIVKCLKLVARNNDVTLQDLA